MAHMLQMGASSSRNRFIERTDQTILCVQPVLSILGSSGQQVSQAVTSPTLGIDI